jgi:hypothetical protein
MPKATAGFPHLLRRADRSRQRTPGQHQAITRRPASAWSRQLEGSRKQVGNDVAFCLFLGGLTVFSILWFVGMSFETIRAKPWLHDDVDYIDMIEHLKGVRYGTKQH